MRFSVCFHYFFHECVRANVYSSRIFTLTSRVAILFRDLFHVFLQKAIINLAKLFNFSAFDFRAQRYNSDWVCILFSSDSQTPGGASITNPLRRVYFSNEVITGGLRRQSFVLFRLRNRRDDRRIRTSPMRDEKVADTQQSWCWHLTSGFENECFFHINWALIRQREAQAECGIRHLNVLEQFLINSLLMQLNTAVVENIFLRLCYRWHRCKKISLCMLRQRCWSLEN